MKAPLLLVYSTPHWPPPTPPSSGNKFTLKTPCQEYQSAQETIIVYRLARKDLTGAPGMGTSSLENDSLVTQHC